MKLTTLNYIHDLLIEDVNIKQNAKRLVYESKQKAEDEGAENYNTFCELYETSKNSYYKAYEALEDFEKHEWR